MKTIAAALLALSLLPAPARAETIKYLEDPVYKLLNKDDHMPMEDMVFLAEEGDPRAQFIMGDLLTKGKGGFPKNMAKGKDWFEKSARGGYYYSFIRLAALSKHAGHPVEAYQWYSLAANSMPSGPDRDYAAKARDAVKKDANLSPDEKKRARDNIDAWIQKSREIAPGEREEYAKKKIEHEEAAAAEAAAHPEAAAEKTKEAAEEAAGMKH